MTELRFDGQVAIISGAARGIGRAHAELLAARGAHVVVNDLGGARSGAGSDSRPAQVAADAIRAAGGSAIPDFSDVSSVEGASQLATRAVDKFGRIDILINNAGIFLPDAFPDVTSEMFQRNLEVHVVGTFNLTRACWPHMVARRYGRVVMTTSTGLLGGSHLTAYGTAKAAVLGLGRSLAQVGEASGIKVNLVAPMALTRMTGESESGVGEDPNRSPALVSPLVAVLCHESCMVTGETFLSGMRRYARIFIAESEGFTNPDGQVTPELIATQWDRIMNVDDHHLTPNTPTWVAQNNERIGRSTPQN